MRAEYLPSERMTKSRRQRSFLVNAAKVFCGVLLALMLGALLLAGTGEAREAEGSLYPFDTDVVPTASRNWSPYVETPVVTQNTYTYYEEPAYQEPVYQEPSNDKKDVWYWY